MYLVQILLHEVSLLTVTDAGCSARSKMESSLFLHKQICKPALI
jgi:hypothetical protein